MVIRQGTKTQYLASSPSLLALGPSVSSPANEFVVLDSAERLGVCICSGNWVCEDAIVLRSTTELIVRASSPANTLLILFCCCTFL